MTISTGRGSERFIVRLPDGMRHRIRMAAAANGRSMNAEIVATLAEKYPEPRSLDEVFAKAVGMRNILALAGAAKSELPALVKRINAHLEAVDLPLRLTVRGGKVALVSIGDAWEEQMAIEDGASE